MIPSQRKQYGARGFINWAPASAPRDCLSLLPVEEKVVSGISGHARDGLSPLPVEEKAIPGLRREPPKVLGELLKSKINYR